MLNQIVIIGRLCQEIKDNIIVISVPRSFKNENGEYDTDLITCRVSGNLAENAEKFCTKDSLIGIKGRIENNNNKIEVIAEKITFLSNSKEEK